MTIDIFGVAVSPQHLIPDHFYITPLGVIAYFFYAAITIFLCSLFYVGILKYINNKKSKWLITLTVILPIILWPLAENYLISLGAVPMCQKHNDMRIYKTVEVEGFEYSPSIEYWSEYGFKYVEWASGTYKRILYRYEMVEGKRVESRVNEFKSRYRVNRKSDEKLGKYYSRDIKKVIDKETGEILAELERVNIYPGYLDGLTSGLFGTLFWGCSGKAMENLPPRDEDLIKATLKPIKL